MSKLIPYLKSVRAEMKHVSWPTRSQALWFTAIVIVLSIATAYYLGAFDWVFTNIIEVIV